MCPHCQDYHATVRQFIEDYVATGQAKFEYRFFPIVHPTYSVFTAQIAECAEVQRDGAFWAAHDLLYDIASDGRIGPDTPEVIAEALDISAEKLETCMATAAQHETDTALAQSLGATGTPAVMVRLPDGTLGWPYLREQVVSQGGLPLGYLDDIVTAGDHAALVVVPQPPLSDLISETACEAPCWRDIVPGETSIADVAELIRADRQNIEISVEELEDGKQAVTWKTFASEVSQPNYILGSPDGIVEEISLIDLSSILLGNVVDVQGEPDFAIAIPNDEETALFYAIYADKGLIVLAFITAEDGLNEDTAVIGAQYFTSDGIDELISGADAPAWEGYDALGQYLRQLP
jgi:hypothetical protein